MIPPSPEPAENGTQRIEAFSDGVFAIAITLLVLEIRIPHTGERGDVANLAHGLRALWPYYFAYVFSFITVGIYWANHHYLFRLFQRTNHVFNMLNVLFLMCISFLPFPTAVLSEYVRSPGNRHSAVSFYALGLLLPALAWTAIWLYGSRRYRLINPELAPEFVAFLTRQYFLSPVFYGLALLASFVNSIIALAIAGGITLLYLFPPRTPRYRPAVKE